MVNPRIIEIIESFLIDNDYDGLYNPYEECGCLLEEGICPCDGPNFDECRAGYRCKVNFEGETIDGVGAETEN